MPGPYQSIGQQTSRFPFTSRKPNAAAPLFYSATDEFREEDDGEEHDREVADFYALQRSRRQFEGASLTDSSDAEGATSREAAHGRNSDTAQNGFRGFTMGRGIRSSWRGDDLSSTVAEPAIATVEEEEEDEEEEDLNSQAARAADTGTKGKERMVDVELASTVNNSFENLHTHPSRDGEMASNPRDSKPAYDLPSPDTQQTPQKSTPLPQETDRDTAIDYPRPPSSNGDGVPSGISDLPPEYPRHDPFWSSLFLICFASLFATYFLVYLHTSAPDKKHPLGDTIYTLLQSSAHLLGVYTVLSAFIALLWFAALRYFAHALAALIVVSVPIISFSFALYPHIASYSGAWHGESIQDRAMRWLSLIPGIFSILWAYTVWKGRRSFTKGLEILNFAGRILAANSPLIHVALANLVAVIAWTWCWKMMFARIFLGGHLSKSKGLFIIDSSSWWLGVYFVLVYLWALSIISGIQRTTTAATVSNWYFHRLAMPAPSARAVVQASLAHATGTMLGTICLSTFLSLAVRLPLLILPRRLAGMLSLAAYSLVPTPIATLTNPLTLTYSAIHSKSLTTAARGMAHLSFVSPTYPSTSLSPHAFLPSSSSSPSNNNNDNNNNDNNNSTLEPYRLAKLLLHATRFVMALALGFGGWVTTARSIEVAQAGVKGSLYAYVVGLIAAAIGWGVLGATEGVLGGIVDALVICWGSEVGGKGYGEARYCREAGELFGDRDRFGSA